MKTQTQFAISFVLAVLLFVATVQAQSQDPRTWIQNGDAAWNGGNTNVALQNYNYAYKLVEQRWDWSSALTLTQRYLALGQETAALNAYRLATFSAWNWAIDPNTLQLRPNTQQVTSGEQGLSTAVNQWNNTLKNLRMSEGTRQGLQQAATQAYQSYQLLQQKKTGVQPPPPPNNGVTLRLSATVLAPGSKLTVYFNAPARAGRSRDWVGMFRAGDDNTKYLGGGYWGYTHGQTSGSMELQVPSTPGRYELRYLLDDGQTDVARGYFFDVR
jgi:hypothetical protein